MSCAYFKQANFDDNGYYTTMNKMLPIGLFSALFLTACGGSDGGSSAPAVKAYTFQFLQMIEEDPDLITNKNRMCNPATATIFKTIEVGDGVKNTYGLEATSGFEVRITDVNNEVISIFDHNDVTSKGTLKLFENQVPNGGYVSVIERDNLGTQLAYALSIQKELLSDSFIKINSTQGQKATCYSGYALKINGAKKEVTISHATGENISKVSAENYFNGKSTPDSASTIENLTVIAPNELVLLSGYGADNAGKLTDITHYSYVDSNKLSNYTPVSSRSIEKLYPIDDFLTITLDATSSNEEFDSLVVNSLYKGYAFNWFGWDTNTNGAYQVSAPLGSSYVYSAQYNSKINGWNVVSNNVVSGSEGSIDLTDMHPRVEPLALHCVTSQQCELNVADAVNQSDSMIKGAVVDYTFTDGEFTMKHSVYAADPVVRIPEVIETRYPDNSVAVNVSVITSANNSKNITDIFSVFGRTKGFTPTVGKVEMFLPPALSLKHEELKIKNNYTVFTK